MVTEVVHAMTEMPFTICRDREVTQVQEEQRETEDQRYVRRCNQQRKWLCHHAVSVFDAFIVSYV